MEAVSRFDNVQVRKAAITPEGYLQASAVVTRSGIFSYLNSDGTIRKELRHPADVFELSSLESVKMRPITNGHPADKLVDANNVKELAIGYTGETVSREGDFIITSILVTDTTGVQEVKSGRKQELSLGYTVDLIKEDGEYNGEKYDYRQKNIRYNHLAIVDKARAGSDARIHLDNLEIQTNVACIDADYTINLTEEASMPEEEMGTVIISGVEYKVAPEVAASYIEAQKMIVELQSKVLELESAQTAITETVDTVTAEKDALKEKLDAAADVNINELIAKAVKQRVSLISTASKLCNIDGMDDLTDIEIKTAAIKHNHPNVNLDGKSEVYIDARFDALVEDFGNTKSTSNIAKQRAVVVTKLDSRDVTSASAARANMIDRLVNGYKNKLQGAK